MRHSLLLTAIACLALVGCGKPSSPTPDAVGTQVSSLRSAAATLTVEAQKLTPAALPVIPTAGVAGSTPAVGTQSSSASSVELKELVSALILRTGVRHVSNPAGAANLYVTYLDAGVREKLVA